MVTVATVPCRYYRGNGFLVKWSKNDYRDLAARYLFSKSLPSLVRTAESPTRTAAHRALGDSDPRPGLSTDSETVGGAKVASAGGPVSPGAVIRMSTSRAVAVAALRVSDRQIHWPPHVRVTSRGTLAA